MHFPSEHRQRRRTFFKESIFNAKGTLVKHKLRNLLRLGILLVIVFFAIHLIFKKSNFTNDLLSQISQQFRLQHIIWEEVSNTNLSHKVTRDLLWRTTLLTPGHELMKIDLPAIEKRLLSLPWIESVQIQKKLPSTLLVKYTVYSAKVLGLRKGKLWFLTSDGRWIAPAQLKDSMISQLPVVASEQKIDFQMAWLKALEHGLEPYVHQIHEVRFSESPERSSPVVHPFVKVLLDIQYPSRLVKVQLITNSVPKSDQQMSDIDRLKKVLQYVIKNNILISSIDLRANKKVVVNVGKRP